MIYVHLTLLVAILALSLLRLGLYSEQRKEKIRQEARLWQHIEAIEADKRSLTESLCRAEGKPFIVPRGTETLAPSDGWFDAAVQVQTKEKIDA